MKAKFGAIVVDGRGKLGGHVFSKNAAGSYMRTKTTPSNPQTSYQTAVRALFASISAGWSSLTEGVRNAWNSAVDDWQKTNVFGDLKKPTGKALYQRLNNQAQSAGWNAVATPPARQDLPDAVVTAVNYIVDAPSLTLVGADVQASTRIMLFATPVLSDGTTFVKNKLRNISNQLANAYDPAVAAAAYTAKFGTPPSETNIYFGIKYVLATGQASPMQIIKGNITEL